MDFPIATRIPSIENSFWNYLSDSIITVDVNHGQPTQAILSHCCTTPVPEAPKSRESPLTYINELTENHMNIWVHVSVISVEVCMIRPLV